MTATKPTRRRSKLRPARRRPCFEPLEGRALLAGFNFADFSDSSPLTLVGSAAITPTDRLELTPAIGGKSGGAWYTQEKQYVGFEFATTFQFQLADFAGSPSGGSDGFALLIQNYTPTFLAGGGGTLGYDGLFNSLAIEFDTFQNSEVSDPSGSHISVHTNGTGRNDWNESLSLGSFDTNPIIDDGQIHTARIVYAQESLSIYLDNLTTPKLIVNVDLADKLNLDAGRAWVGFTGTTGGGWETHDILSWSFDTTIPATAVSIGDASVVEGNAGTTSMDFEITRAGDLSGITTVNWATGTGTAASPSDYAASAGQVTFNSGEATKTVSVNIQGDVTLETSEAFTVNLSGATGAIIVGGTATGTILNDEITVTIADLATTEGTTSASSMGSFVSVGSGGLANARNIVFGPDGNLYVASQDTDSVLRYDGVTGIFLDAFVPSGAGGLDAPWAIAFGPDGNLYATGTLSNSVLRYNGATGAFIDQFIPTGASGLNQPKGITFDGNGDLYVSSTTGGGGRVGPHQVLRFQGPNSTTPGAPLPAQNQSGATFVSDGSGGLSNPNGLAFGPDGNLYVANTFGDRISRYSAATGAALGDFVATGSGGLDAPNFMVFRPDGALYVASQSSRQVLRYDATTGAFIDVFVPIDNGGLGSPMGLAFDASGVLYASGGTPAQVLRYAPPPFASVLVSLNNSSVTPVTVNYTTVAGSALEGADYVAASGTLTFAPGVTTQAVLVNVPDDALVESDETFRVVLSNASGATVADGDGTVTIVDDETLRQISINDVTVNEGGAPHFRQVFVTRNSAGLVNPRTPIFHNGMLYVLNESANSVIRYNAATGAFIDYFIGSDPQLNGGLARPMSMAFGPDGNLYIVTYETNQVHRYDGTTGAFIDIFVSAGSGGLSFASDLAFDSAGNLYVTTDISAQVLRYDTNGNPNPGPLGSPGNAIFVPSNSGSLVGARGIVFDGSGNLLVASIGNDKVLKFSGATGAFISEFVAAGSGGLDEPHSIAIGPDGNLYVGSTSLDAVFRYSGTSGAFIDTFVPTGSGGLNNTIGLTFDGNGRLYVASGFSWEILQFSAEPEAIFTVSLPGVVTTPVSVGFATASGSAVSGSDFVPASGTITIVPGKTSQSLFVPLIDDTTYESNESFTVNLSSPVGGVIVDGQGVGTIVDNDPPPAPPTKFYVVDDGSANKTYEYAASGAAVENYAVNSGNTAPRGAASTAAGDKVWVVDANKNVYVYGTSGNLLGSWTAGSLPSNASVQGITTNGTDVWLVDDKGNKVYRYAGAASRLSGSQNAASSFSLNSSNGNPSDLVTDGTSIWVVNNAAGWFSTDKVFKYTVSGTLQGSWTISGGGGSPTGITIDPANVSNIWIVDSSSDRIYQFNGAASRTSGSQSPSTSFALAAGNTNPQGLADPPTAGGSAAYDSALLTIVGELDDVLGTGKKRR